MRNAQKWKLLAVALASFAIAALAASTTSDIRVASAHGDGGVAEAPVTMDAGMTNSQDMDGGMPPGELQGSLRGTPRTYAKTVRE